MSKVNTQNRQYYDDFSGWYERERGRGYHALIDELEVDAIAPYVRDARVLEAGCGTGLILERLRTLADDVWGFDLSPGMVAKARSRGLNVALGSVTQVPFASNSFDLVCCFKVLPHVPEIGQALSELARVTKPGGTLAVEFYNPWSLRYLAKRASGPRPISERRDEGDVYTRWDAPSAIRRVLPPSVDLVDFRGVRVVTPAAFVHKVPVLGASIAAVERASVRSPFRYFGGFLVAILSKRQSA